MDSMLYLAPVMGIVALLFAFYLASKVGKQDAGTDRMKEIAAAISDGAHAFLMSEYKILVIFVIVLFVLIGVGIGNWVTAVCFLLGGIFFHSSRLLWYECGNQGQCPHCQRCQDRRNEQSVIHRFLRRRCYGYVCGRSGCAGCRRCLHGNEERGRSVRLQPWRIFHRSVCPCWRRYLYEGC